MPACHLCCAQVNCKSMVRILLVSGHGCDGVGNRAWAEGFGRATQSHAITLRMHLHSWEPWLPCSSPPRRSDRTKCASEQLHSPRMTPRGMRLSTPLPCAFRPCTGILHVDVVAHPEGSPHMQDPRTPHLMCPHSFSTSHHTALLLTHILLLRAFSCTPCCVCTSCGCLVLCL